MEFPFLFIGILTITLTCCSLAFHRLNDLYSLDYDIFLQSDE